MHFHVLDKVANLTGVWIDELNTTRGLTGVRHDMLTEPISILNDSSVYDFNAPFINMEHACQKNKIYRLSIEVRNGVFLDTFSADIVVPDLIAKSSKKYFPVPNDYLVDAYFPYDMHITTADVVNVNFTYTWIYMDNENVTEVDTLHIASPPLIGKCYEARLKLNSSQLLEVNVNRTICVDIGINGTAEFNFANSLGENTYIDVLMDRFGNSSCIALDFAGAFYVNSQEFCNMHFPEASGASLMTFSNDISTVSHLFPGIGEYPVRFIAKNNVHDQIDEFVIAVINLTCQVPEVEIIGMCETLFLPYITMHNIYQVVLHCSFSSFSVTCVFFSLLICDDLIL